MCALLQRQGARRGKSTDLGYLQARVFPAEWRRSCLNRRTGVLASGGLCLEVVFGGVEGKRWVDIAIAMDWERLAMPVGIWKGYERMTG